MEQKKTESSQHDEKLPVSGSYIMSKDDEQRLIALFMGAEEYEPNWFRFNSPPIKLTLYESNLIWNIECMQYSSSFDWLIPVCRKLDSYYNENWNANQNSEYVSLSNRLDDNISLYEILPVYKTVIDFIMWVNNNSIPKISMKQQDIPNH